MNYVDTADGKRYVLRIYNNGNNTDRVRREHEILQQLSRQKLSFQVPRTVPTLKTGESFVVLSTGTSACVFEIIPGEGDAPQMNPTRGCREVEDCSAAGAFTRAFCRGGGGGDRWTTCRAPYEQST